MAADLEILSPISPEEGIATPTFVLALILIGEACVKASKYKQLGLALQKRLESGAQTWVAILSSPCPCTINSENTLQEKVDQLSKEIDEVVTRLAETGAIKKSQGSRITNGVFLGHGVGGVVAQELAFKRAVGFVSISAPLRMPFPTQWFWPSMVLNGEMDEELALGQLAAPVLDVVRNFGEHGKAKMMRRKPVVVLPDTNLSDVFENNEVVDQVCNLIGAFLLLNSVPGYSQDRHLFENLKEAMDVSVSMVAPYLRVLGRGDMLKEISRQDSLSDSCTPDHSGLERATGVEIFSQVTRPKSTFALEERAALATPGELAALREFSKAVQLKFLEGFLAPDVVSRIKVNVETLTTSKNFLWGQPTVEKFDLEETGKFDGVLTVRALLHHPHLEGFQHIKSVAPSYWIKLKKPSAVSLLFSPTDLDTPRKMDSDFDSRFSAQGVMEEALENVLTLIPSRVKERYESSGVKVRFAADNKFASAPEWAGDVDWEVAYNAGENAWEIRCAIVEGPSIGRDGKPIPMLFGSAFYMKVPSPAWLLEFVSSR